MLRLCEPIYPEEINICKKTIEEAEKVKPIEENPYAVFLAKKLRKQFYDPETKMIAVFHLNCYSGNEMLRIKGMLFDSKFEMELYEKVNAKVAGLALRGTKFEPVLQLVTMPTALGFCRTTDVKKLLQVNKKMPAFVLLGIIVDNRLLRRADLEEYASKDLNMVRAHLSHTLSSASGKSLSSLLESNSLCLSNNLASYVSSQNEGSEKTPKEPAE
jgi:hypothetical protein